MRWRLFPLFELAMRLAERDMTELVAGGNKHGPNGGNIGHEGRDVNTGFGGDRSLSARALTPDMSTSDDVWSVGGGRRSWGVKTERLTPTPLAMTNPLQRRLVIGLATACLAASVVALPSADAQDDSRAQLTTSGMMGGLHYGVPLKWSIALGYILPGSYKDWQPFAAVEPGIGGFRASLGALKMTNELGGGYYALCYCAPHH